MAKTKVKTKTKAKTLTAFLTSMGVDNPEELFKADLEEAKELGKSVHDEIHSGRHAMGILRSMQGRRPDEEAIKMGCAAKRGKYDTVEEFAKHSPSFVCATSSADQKLMSWDGSKLELQKGQDLCMTGTEYCNHVRQRPTLVPAKKTFIERYRQYRGEDLTDKRLFVWRTGGIGDILFIRPILLAFKAKYPGIDITFACRSRYHSMIEQWEDCIDGITQTPFLCSETLDVTDYHISFEGLIENCKDAERMDVHDLFARHSCIEVEKYNCPMKCIVKNHFFDLVRRDYVVVQLRASSPIRTPLYRSFVDVVNHLTKTIDVIIADSPQGSRAIDDFSSCCERPDRIINFARHTGSIVDAVRLVSGAKLVIGPDSSFVHMAASQGIPAIGLYGPFPARTRTAHYRQCITVEPDKSDCCSFGGRECFTHSHLPCHYQGKCWRHLDSQKIIDATETLLNDKTTKQGAIHAHRPSERNRRRDL